MHKQTLSLYRELRVCFMKTIEIAYNGLIRYNIKCATHSTDKANRSAVMAAIN